MKPDRPSKALLWLRRNVNPLLENCSKLLAPAAWLQGREVVYQQLVHRDLERLNIRAPFYPVRSAANYGLFYLLLRLVQELPQLRILELGAGQSTILLDRLVASHSLQCTTLESDPEWFSRISDQVKSARVLNAPLEQRVVNRRACSAYDPAVLDAGARFNVLVVDGPRKNHRRSRWGCLELIEDRLEEEFLVVFDDAERRGEQQTIAEALKLLERKGCNYATSQVRAANSQFLIATGRFRTALYF